MGTAVPDINRVSYALGRSHGSSVICGYGYGYFERLVPESQ